MEKVSSGVQIKFAKILLIALIISIEFDIGAFFQTEYQLKSVFIPKSLILEISRPYLVAALISVLVFIVALLSYFFSKYLFSKIICGLGLAWQYYFLNWGAYGNMQRITWACQNLRRL
jgi:hypothetical protein